MWSISTAGAAFMVGLLAQVRRRSEVLSRMRCSAKLLRSGALLIRDWSKRRSLERSRFCSATLRARALLAALRPGQVRLVSPLPYRRRRKPETLEYALDGSIRRQGRDRLIEVGAQENLAGEHHGADIHARIGQ